MFSITIKNQSWSCIYKYMDNKCEAIRLANDLITTGSVTVEDTGNKEIVLVISKDWSNPQQVYNAKIQEKIDAARKDRNAEAVFYYSQKMGLSTCDTFNNFESSNGFDDWALRNEESIIKIQKEFLSEKIEKFQKKLLLTAKEVESQKLLPANI